MKKPKDVRTYLRHIAAEINDIKIFLKGMSEKRFSQDVKTQKAVVRSLEVIGEAVKNLPNDIRKKHGEVDWEGVAGLRDVIVHEYFDLDLERIWKIVVEDLPGLKKQVEKILAEG